MKGIKFLPLLTIGAGICAMMRRYECVAGHVNKLAAPKSLCIPVKAWNVVYKTKQVVLEYVNA